MFLQFSEFLQNETLTLGRNSQLTLSASSDPRFSKNDMQKTEKTTIKNKIMVSVLTIITAGARKIKLDSSVAYE